MILLRLPLLLTATILAGALSSHGDEFDALRLKWRDMLTFGTNASKANTNYALWISSVGSKAQSYSTSMNLNPTRTNLWSDLNHLDSVSSDITGTYTRLKAMAMGYAVHGSSLENNVALRGNIIGGVDWMYTNYYNEGVLNEYDNWFDWEIGAPLNLNDITVLLYDNLTGAQIANYMNTVDHFTSTPFTPNLTAANTVWKASVAAVSGVIARSSPKLTSTQQSLSSVFPYITSGDGFYADGSFVFHSIFSYNGGYGAQLIGTMGPLMQLLTGSTWQVTDPAQTNLFRWIYDSFEPFIYRGAIMQMTDGRYYSRQGDDHLEGHGVLASILRLAQFAPPADVAGYKSLIKYWIQTDTYRDFIQTQSPPFNVWANNLMNDPAVTPAGELVRHYQFPHMDQAVHLRPGWGFALSMSSSRSGNFESIQGENLHGWYTGDGMTYLYNADLDQFADDFWSTVNPYRMPGTTVDTQIRAPGSGEGYLSPNDWVGGASLQNLYGLCGMQLTDGNSSLRAKKSWFMFDNEVVCLGAGITSSDNRGIETTIENRRLSGYGNNTFTVNGSIKTDSVGWSETMTNTSWAHLAGNVPGADLGYFFPQSATVEALREARSGAFSDINANYGSTDRTTRNYLTLWFNHGLNPPKASYAYVLLPGQSAAQVAGYAANPDIIVLANSTQAQGVTETTLGLTAVNFWKDSNSLGGISVDKASSVIVRNDGTFLELGISDPTQTNTGLINLEITNAIAATTLSADPGVAVVQLSPTIKLAVDVSGAGGKTFHARFFVGPMQTVILSPLADAYVENGTNANVNFGAASSLVVKTNSSTTNLTREAYLRFELPPAPGMILSATLRLVPVSPYVQNSLWHALALAGDNSWTESGITWNNKPAAGPELTRWLVPSTNTPVLVPVTALAQQAAAQDGAISFRVYPAGANTAFTAYAAKEHNTATSRPQLILNLGRIPPAVTLTSSVNSSVLDAPAALTLVADAQLSAGMVTNVDFYSGPTKLAQFTTAFCSLPLSNLAAGPYSFTAVATDSAGLMSTSAPVIVAVYNPQPVGRGAGLIGEYYTNLDCIGLVLTRTDPTVNFSWGSGSPASSIPSDRFSVRWLGKLQPEHAGLHLFHTVSDEGARLWVNGQLLIDDWEAHSATEDTGAISLVPGEYYDIRMEYFDNTGPAVAQLLWTQPGGTKEVIPQTQLYPAANGLVGSYSAGANATNYVLTRIDDTVNFSWGNSSPDPTLLVAGFSVHWSGRVRANQGGTYTFYTLSAGAVRLWVNNQLIISNWTEHASTENSGTVTLAAGQLYRLTMDYFNSTGGAAAVLMWLPPGPDAVKQVIPEANLTPSQNNNPPALGPIRNTAMARSVLLTFTATATDADLPTQSLTFSLEPGAPAGASINPATGLFTWTPASTQALGNYTVTVRVTDNGAPVMTDAQAFTVTVSTNLIAAAVTLAPTGALWRYLDNGADPDTAWRSNNFNDGSWKSGSAQLGYGTGDESTLVSYGPDPSNKRITTYFRRTFFVPDTALVQSLSARLLRNDGAVVYLNGAEVWRDNLPAGVVTSATLASSAITGASATNYLITTLDLTALINGTNLMAVEIHLDSPAGPDIGFDFALAGVAVVPTQAALAIANGGGSPVLSWPMAAGLFQLYTATNLAPPVTWTRRPDMPAISNGRCVLPLAAPANGVQFYRLQAE